MADFWRQEAGIVQAERLSSCRIKGAYGIADIAVAFTMNTTDKRRRMNFEEGQDAR